MDRLREEIAEKEHEQWAHWTEYFVYHLSGDNLARWKEQAKKAYSDLSESEKDADRKWADIILSILRAKHKPEPSGVVVKRECKSILHEHQDEDGMERNCTLCNNTRIISRELSKDELAEVPKMLLKGEAIAVIDLCSKKVTHIILPSGERLEVKEG